MIQRGCGMSRDLDFDLDRLEAAIGGPLALAPVASGQSNPTWFVTRGDERMVLRKNLRARPCPPLMRSNGNTRSWRRFTAATFLCLV